MSILLRNRIKFVCLRCPFDTTDVHRLTESSCVISFCYVHSPRLDPLNLQAYSLSDLRRELDQSNLETLSPWRPLIDMDIPDGSKEYDGIHIIKVRSPSRYQSILKQSNLIKGESNHTSLFNQRLDRDVSTPRIHSLVIGVHQHQIYANLPIGWGLTRFS